MDGGRVTALLESLTQVIGTSGSRHVRALQTANLTQQGRWLPTPLVAPPRRWLPGLLLGRWRQGIARDIPVTRVRSNGSRSSSANRREGC